MLFPANSRGFIYYHTSPSIPETAGELRFRLTQGDDPELFQAGSDLLSIEGLTWNIPLVVVAHNRSFRVFRSLLLRDNLVSPALMDLCAGLSMRSPSRVIHSLGQPFHVDFSRTSIPFVILSRSSCCKLEVMNLFTHQAADKKAIVPYAGKQDDDKFCFTFDIDFCSPRICALLLRAVDIARAPGHPHACDARSQDHDARDVSPACLQWSSAQASGGRTRETPRRQPPPHRPLVA